MNLSRWLYSLIALLSYQMVNNEVHWMSDYPFALGMGYLFGKVVVGADRTKIEENGKVKREKFTLSPYFGIGKLTMLT